MTAGSWQYKALETITHDLVFLVTFCKNKQKLTWLQDATYMPEQACDLYVKRLQVLPADNAQLSQPDGLAPDCGLCAKQETTSLQDATVYESFLSMQAQSHLTVSAGTAKILE